MATTTFAAGTVIASTWLNDVNDIVYGEAQHVAPAGSVTVPSYSFLGDLNNGWWSPAADTQAWSIAGSEAMRLSSTGLGLGGTPAVRLHVAPTGASSHELQIGTYLTGIGVYQGVSNDPAIMYGNTSTLRIGTVTGLNATGFLENFRFDSSGNALVTGPGGLGYGTGSGGTVTQATSKSTGVTLNKANGKITMHNASLASGATVAFVLTNSTIGANDYVYVSLAGGIGAADQYQVWCNNDVAGSVGIALKNNTAGALADAVAIKFVVIKGAVT